MKYLAINILLLLLMAGCTKEEYDIFSESPSQRSQKAVEALYQTLSAAPQGWEMTYFPEIDTSILNNLSINIYTTGAELFNIAERPFIKKGGQIFLVKFKENGNLDMAVHDAPVQSSHYRVTQNTMLQLSFISRNYIHRYKKSDFLFEKKDKEGNLVFRTNNYLEGDKEYVYLKKIEDKPAIWSDKNNRTQQNARLFAEWGIRKQLTIKDEKQQIVYESTETKENKAKQYLIFIRNNDATSYNSKNYSGLGSGYSASSEGLKFLPGFRYSKDIIFTDFVRTEDKFISKVGQYTAEITQKIKDQ